MDRDYEKYHIYRILSGVFKIVIDEKIYYVKNNTKEEKFEIQEVYFDIYRRAEEQGTMTLEESYLLLAESGGWDGSKESRLKETPNVINSLKLQIYKAFHTSKIRENLRRQLRDKEKEQHKLLSQKNSLMNSTCEGIATIHSNHYSFYTRTTDEQGNYIKNTIKFQDISSSLLEDIYTKYQFLQTDEKEIRELSRSDVWRHIWGSKEHSKGVFDMYASDLTDEQSGLISWSSFYDQIRNNPELPSEDIVNDNDAIDGWVREQVEKNKQEKSKNANEMNATEIFIPADNDEDIQRIHGMNDVSARITKRLREKAIDKHGTLKEADLPDVKIELQRQSNEQYKNTVKGGR